MIPGVSLDGASPLHTVAPLYGDPGYMIPKPKVPGPSCAVAFRFCCTLTRRTSRPNPGERAYAAAPFVRYYTVLYLITS